MLLAVACAALGCDDYFYVCPVGDPARVAQLPAHLSETGLYQQPGEIAGDVLAYRPAFELWADGADKRRWLKLPPGAVIDTSNMDSWRFPAGTQVWKEFSQNGRLLETRLIQKIGPGPTDWAAVAYVWRDDQEDADPALDGYLDVRGTRHDAPAAGECLACHGGRTSFLLGVSAVQLSQPAASGEVDLLELAARGLLSDAPARAPSIPGDEVERAALGYLHANCSHCHNQSRPTGELTPCMDPDNSMNLLLSTADLDSVEQTPAYRTVVGHQIVPGHPEDSELIARASTRTIFYRMPPLGSEEVDQASIDLLERWIESMR